MEITLTVPEELATRPRPVQRELPTPEEILALRPSAAFAGKKSWRELDSRGTTRVGAVSVHRTPRSSGQGHCGYCLLPEAFSLATPWVDHLVAEKHDGQTAEDNLALSCVLCNQHKGTDLASIEPRTAQLQYEEGGSRRVYRGGCFSYDGQDCRAANRNRNAPSNRNNNLPVLVAHAKAPGGLRNAGHFRC